MTLFGRAPRMDFVNLSSGDVMTPMFNPTQLEEELRVNYNDLDVLGLSHKPSQYKNTDNHKFRFTLRFDALAIEEWAGSIWQSAKGASIINARNYLLSLCYAPRGAQDILGGAPPRVLFFWPELVHIESTIRSLRFTHMTFSSETGEPSRFDVAMELHATRDVRLVSEEVFDKGTFRTA